MVADKRIKPGAIVFGTQIVTDAKGNFEIAQVVPVSNTTYNLQTIQEVSS